MASYVKRGTFAKRSGTGTQSITGLGFQPKALWLRSLGMTDTSGVSNGDVRTMQAVIGPGGEYAAATATRQGVSATSRFTHRLYDEAAALIVHWDGTVLARANLDSVDPDGFTLDWTASDANAYAIEYIAFGGDIDVAVGTWAVPNSTGTSSVTGLGFQPDLLAVIHAGSASSAPSTTTNANQGFGWANASGQFAHSTGLAAISGQSNQHSSTLHNDHLVVMTNSVGANRVNANLDSFDVGGFTLDVTARDAAYDGALVPYLAIRGVSSAVGDFQRDGTSDDVVPGLAFEPDSLLTVSINSVTRNQIGNDALWARVAVGIGDASGQRVSSWLASGGAGVVATRGDRIQESGLIYAWATIDQDVRSELDSIDPDGFTISPVAGTNAHWINYVALAGIPGVKLDLRSGIEIGTRINVQVDVPVHIRSGIEVGSRLDLKTGEDDEVAIRSGIEVGTRIHVATEQAIASRSGIEIGTRINVVVEVPVRIRSGIEIGSRAAIQHWRNVRIRSGIEVGMRDAYTGPGTGIVVQGESFSPNELREGDSFNVVLPWAGLQGMSGLAHVRSRTMRDDRDEQDITLDVAPHPDPRLVPRMAGGGRPGIQPVRSDIARRVARQERQQDRIERERSQ